MTDPAPNLNTAAADLIAALDEMETIRGFREGLRPMLAFAQATVTGSAQDAQARELLRVWQSLDALAEAVQIRKGVL